MNDEILIIFSISFIIFASPLLSRITKIPTIPIEIILGAIFAAFSLIHEHALFEQVAELGFLYLMFLAGLEVDLKTLVTVPKRILKKAILYNILLFSMSFMITLYLDLSKIFIVILPLISIGVLAALKKEYGDTPWIKLSILVGIIGEVISIFALTTVAAGLELGFGWEFIKTMFLFIVFLIALLLVYKVFHNLIWWFPQIKAYLMPENDHEEQDIRVSMAIFFVMIAVMIYLQLEVAFGAFIAGTFVTTFFAEHNKSLPTKLEHFGFGWLVPIFFVSVGSSFDLSALFDDTLVEKAFLITFTMILMRVIASMLFIKELGSDKFILLALSHSMPLTLLIAVATLAYHNHSITEFWYFAFILAAILEVLFVMIVIRIYSNILKKKII